LVVTPKIRQEKQTCTASTHEILFNLPRMTYNHLASKPLLD
jgi:hypothetical protein